MRIVAIVRNKVAIVKYEIVIVSCVVSIVRDFISITKNKISLRLHLHLRQSPLFISFTLSFHTNNTLLPWHTSHLSGVI